MDKKDSPQVAWRKRKAEKGLCTACGAPSAPGRKYCEYHLTKAVENTKKRQEQWQQSGLCVACGKRPPMDNLVRCAECNSRYKTKEHIARRKELNKIRMEERKQSGICLKCDRPAMQGRVTCEHHLVQATKRAYERQQENKKKGLCPYCGNDPVPGKKLCEQCRQRAINQNRRDRFGGNWQTVLDRDNNKCQLCDNTEKLHIHHIDGNGYGQKTPNNDIDNLIVLCHACHLNLTYLIKRATDKTLLIQLLLAQETTRSSQ